MYVCTEGLRRFKAKNPLVPLQGLIANQMLVVRPDETGDLKVIDDLMDTAFLQKYRRMPPSRGIPPRWAADRVRQIQNWKDGIPPNPDWTQIDARTHSLLQDDMPEQPVKDDELMIDFDTANLQLTDHQKVMLMPPEERMATHVYPGSIQSRVKEISSSRKKVRKNRWGNKFGNYFLGKTFLNFRKKVRKHGLTKATSMVQPTAKQREQVPKKITIEWLDKTKAKMEAKDQGIPNFAVPFTKPSLTLQRINQNILVNHNILRAIELGNKALGSKELGNNALGRQELGLNLCPTQCHTPTR